MNKVNHDICYILKQHLKYCVLGLETYLNNPATKIVFLKKKMFVFSIRTGPTLSSPATHDGSSVDRSFGYLVSYPSLMLVSMPLI